MITYQITTLVDITNSNARRDDIDHVIVSQQSNFDTLVQTIGLRANIEWNDPPDVCSGKCEELVITGSQRYWQWKFFVDKESIFEDDSSPVGLLITDLHGVPIIDKLTETKKLHVPTFITIGKYINTQIKLIK